MSALRGLWTHGRDPMLLNSVFLIANNLFPALVSLVFLKIVATHYATEQIGLASVLISLSNMVAVASGLGLGAVAIRFIPEMAHEERDLFVTASMLAVLVAGVLASGAVLWIGPGFTDELARAAREPLLALSFVATGAAMALSILLDNVFISRRSAKHALAKNLAGALARLPVPLLLASQAAVLGIFAGYLAGALLAVALGLAWYLPRVLPGYRPRLRGGASTIWGHRHYGGANYAVSLAPVLQTSVLNLLVLNAYGPGPTAYFYVALAFMTMLYVIPQGISHPLLSEGIADPERFDRLFVKALAFVYALLLPGVLVLAAGAPFVLGLLDAEFAANGSVLLAWMALSALPAGVNVLHVSRLRLLRRTRELLLTSVALAATNLLGVAAVVAARLPIEAVGVALLAVQSAFLLLALLRTRAFRRERARASPALRTAEQEGPA